MALAEEKLRIDLFRISGNSCSFFQRRKRIWLCPCSLCWNNHCTVRKKRSEFLDLLYWYPVISTTII